MVSVLFVCMGNICRSPSAEGAFLNLLEMQGVLRQIEVDSAGTHAYHVGEKADSRSIQAAFNRGIDLSYHRARQVTARDFEIYDYILAMDLNNYEILLKQCPPQHHPKVHLFLERFAPQLKKREVPDPYYGGGSGFEHVLDLVEVAAAGLLTHIQASHLKAPPSLETP